MTPVVIGAGTPYRARVSANVANGTPRSARAYQERNHRMPHNSPVNTVGEGAQGNGNNHGRTPLRLSSAVRDSRIRCQVSGSLNARLGGGLPGELRLSH